MVKIVHYAGIGSRETPPEILQIMKELAQKLAKRDFYLHSGGAEGADTAFEEGCDDGHGLKAIFLPWDGFNDRFSDSSGVHSLARMDKLIVDQAMKVAEKHHPNWSGLTKGGKSLHTRNVFQILGLSLEKPVSFVVCWTKNASGSGGTGQALRIAKAHSIPIFDLADPTALDRVSRFANS